MTARTVGVGVMTYTAKEGELLTFALLGEVVDVADSDLERFDRLNGTPVAVEKPRRGRPKSKTE